MAWDNYIVVTKEHTIRTYRVKAQSYYHARRRLEGGADDDMLEISPGEEEVVDVYRERER